MDSKGPAKADPRYNSNGDLLLARTSAGVYNDASWMNYIRDTILVPFPDIKVAFDIGEDLSQYPDIDPNMWIHPPVAADPIAVPPIIAYPGRRKYPIGPDGYPTEAADIAIQKDQELLDKKRVVRTDKKQSMHGTDSENNSSCSSRRHH
jgi:hypothetical protein